MISPSTSFKVGMLNLPVVNGDAPIIAQKEANHFINRQEISNLFNYQEERLDFRGEFIIRHSGLIGRHRLEENSIQNVYLWQCDPITDPGG